MYLFKGPKSRVSEVTQTIQEVTRGSFFEKWNRRSGPTYKITTRGKKKKKKKICLIKIIKACVKDPQPSR